MLQPFTGTIASMVYTEQVVMFGSFLGFLFVVYGLRGARTISRALFLYAGALLVGMASMLRVDVLALNLVAMMLLVAWVWLRRRSAWKATLFALALSLVIPLTVSGLQYQSTGEFRLAKESTMWRWFSGWARTLTLDRNDYVGIAFNVDSTLGRGKSIEALPPHVFVSGEEHNRVAFLLEHWRRFGYDETVDAGFARLAKNRIKANPFGFYIVNPLYRMQHFWLNRDGGQFYIVPLALRPPLSTFVALATLLGRLSIFILFLLGAMATIGSARSRHSKAPMPTTFDDVFALFSIAYVLLRTLELGVVGVFKYAALMEIRYISVAVPFALVLSVRGVEALTRRWRSRDVRGFILS